MLHKVAQKLHLNLPPTVPDNRQVTRLNYINKINSMKKVSDRLIIVEKEKTKKLNMPIYISKAILDLTKYFMHDFFYNVVIKYYPNAKLLYMDTDSFIIEFPVTVEGFTALKDSIASCDVVFRRFIFIFIFYE